MIEMLNWLFPNVRTAVLRDHAQRKAKRKWIWMWNMLIKPSISGFICPDDEFEVSNSRTGLNYSKLNARKHQLDWQSCEIGRENLYLGHNRQTILHPSPVPLEVVQTTCTYCCLTCLHKQLYRKTTWLLIPRYLSPLSALYSTSETCT